jgi:hypothetical protein
MKHCRPSGLVSTFVALAALVAAGVAGATTPLPQPVLDVLPTETLVTFPVADATTGSVPPDRGALVALPADATTVTASLLGGQAGRVEVLGGLRRLRGVPTALVRVHDVGPGAVRVAVRHDGHWRGKAASPRLVSPALHAGLPGLPADTGKAVVTAVGGSYLIITAPQFAGALQPLVDWKTRKGWPVTLATTDETGTSNAGIRDWIGDAYTNWAQPPEYVLLVGDVDTVPSWSFSGNVTDLPYSLHDGDDWLPDLMLGRFSVSNQTECQAMVAKTVHYEQDPPVDQTDWYTRGVMVAGQYASTTPMHTVRYCGEQLETLGFDPVDPVRPLDFSDPEDWVYSDGNYIVSPLQNQLGIGVRQNEGPKVVKDAIDAGAAMVVYRGWAYGVAGWEPPHYTTAEIPALANGAMTPVVMSFVCLNGDFSASDICFGEVFTRVGGTTPETFKGAVAFIGNGEHWSHTRYNDGMAISVFERIVDPSLTTLGSVLNAGKMRFLEYFPGQLEDQGDENSCEFYFHIYNLLGDPELNYHRGVPQDLDVAHADELPVGTNWLEITARTAGGALLPGARVGVVQGGVLIGAAITDEVGGARVGLRPVEDGPVTVTVTAPGHRPYSTTLGATGAASLGVASLGVDDAAGNGDGVANPGETLDLGVVLQNFGGEATAAGEATLTVSGPASVVTAGAAVPAIAPGATVAVATPLQIAIDPAAADGARIAGRLQIDHDDRSEILAFDLPVLAPRLVATAHTADGESWLAAGTTSDLTLALANDGGAATAGATIDLQLEAADGVTLLTSSVAVGAVASGAVAEAGPVTIALAGDVPEGRPVVLRLAIATDEGGTQQTTVTVPVGPGAPGEPTGPDAHGYHAYDSADYLYPDQRPVYRWREISSAFGGPGTRLPLDAGNYATEVTVDLPFTFRFYGEDFSRVRVSDNGWISFHDTDDSYNFYNWPLPSTHGNGAVVAPFWDNLTTEPMDDPESDPVGLDSDGVYWYHDADAGEFIVQWSRMRHYKTVVAEDESGPGVTDLKTFQAVLRDPALYPTPTGDGEILFYYREVVDNDYLRMYASVGIEAPGERDGLQLTYDSIRSPGVLTFGAGQAVRLTTAPPVRVPLAVTSLARGQNGGSATLTWRCTDTRPVLGWRIWAVRGGERTLLTPEPLPADARAASVAAIAEDDLLIEALLPHGTTTVAGTAAAGTTLALRLGSPTPNPTAGEASITFALPRRGEVRLRVFDVRGRLVRTLVDGDTAAGEAVAVWKGRDDGGRTVADGVYFYRLEHAGQTLTRKLLLVR